MGIDAFLEIDTWKDANRLLSSCNFAVIGREGTAFPDLTDAMKKNLSEEFNDSQFRLEGIEPGSGLKCFRQNSSDRVIIPVETTAVEISSTQIRKKVKSGNSIKKLLPEKVNIYIENNKLYH